MRNRLVDALYGTCVVLFILAFVAAFLREDSLAGSNQFLFSILLVVVLALAFRRQTRLFAVIGVVTVSAPLYFFEAYLVIIAPKSNIALFQELRLEHPQIYPLVSPSTMIELSLRDGGAKPLKVSDREILPLGGIPDVQTAYCKEANGIVAYWSDSFGFRNPKDVLKIQSPALVMLGDSFAQGYCVPEEATWRLRLSAIGPVATLGISGSSALVQYATYKEYAASHKPRRVVWFFYEGNDLKDYLLERSTSLINAYLDTNHTQHLVAKRKVLTDAFRQHMDQALADNGITGRSPFLFSTTAALHGLRGFVGLSKMRYALLNVVRSTRFFSDFAPDLLPEFPDEAWDEIVSLWRRVLDVQHEHGGLITFVYVPSYWHFSANGHPTLAKLEMRVRGLWAKLGVDSISLTDIIARRNDPRTAYALPNGDHFTADVYKETADYILEHLQRKPK